MLQLVFGAVGLLFVVVGLPLSRRQIRPNRWYGLRVPATLKSEKVWYQANAVSGRDFTGFGVSFTLFAVALPRFIHLPDDTYALTCATVLAVGTVIVAIRGIRLATRLRDAEEGAP